MENLKIVQTEKEILAALTRVQGDITSEEHADWKTQRSTVLLSLRLELAALDVFKRFFITGEIDDKTRGYMMGLSYALGLIEELIERE